MYAEERIKAEIRASWTSCKIHLASAVTQFMDFDPIGMRVLGRFVHRDLLSISPAIKASEN